MKEVEESETIPTPKAQTVKRSALFGFIGSISRTLFGTLNEKDEEYKNKKNRRIIQGRNNPCQTCKRRNSTNLPP